MIVARPPRHLLFERVYLPAFFFVAFLIPKVQLLVDTLGVQQIELLVRSESIHNAVGQA